MPQTKKSLFSKIAWNVSGPAVPLAIALIAVPKLLNGYGDARFGFLSIVWALIGYFSIFDFGLGRALTKLASDRLGSARQGEIPALSATALTAMLMLGIAAAATVLAIAPTLVGLLELPDALIEETTSSLRILALSLPFVIVSAGAVGLLEAHGSFKASNLIRIGMGVLNFGGPLLVLCWSQSLVPATVSLAVTRVLACSAYLIVANREGYIVLSNFRIISSYVRELLAFGSWITVSNLVSPLMAQLDKFIVGSVVAVALLPLYSVPSDLVSRLGFAPMAIVGVFFPAFAAAKAASNSTETKRLYGGALDVVLGTMLPCCLILTMFSSEGLAFWLDETFAEKAAPLVVWLTVGLLANSAARVPSALLQATGRPDVTAKIHLIELPVYAVGLWALLAHYGVAGAAIAWAVRMALDLIFLKIATARLLPDLSRITWNKLTLIVIGTVTLFASTLIDNMYLKVAIAAVAGATGLSLSSRSLLGLKKDFK